MKNEEWKTERKIKIGRHPIRADLSLGVRRLSFVILLSVLAGFFSASTFAQTSSNRWLLIFDISSSMHSRAKGTHDVMEDLLRTGMHGQLRSGDTIGIWTYNDKLQEGMPLQVWSADDTQMIFRHTMQYVDDLHYGKSAKMEVALTNMFNVVDMSKFITIVLFSDGDQPVNGTPFDEQINNLYKENYHHQKREDMPIITVLQARRGSFIANTVNFAPWPVDIPAIPLPVAAKPVAPPIAPAPKPAPPPSTVPPLIYDGRKDAANQSPPPTATENKPSTMTAPADDSSASAPPAATEQTAVAPKVETAAPLPTTTTTETTQPAATPPAAVSELSESQSKPAAAPAPAPVAQNESEPPAPQPETASKAATPSVVETATSAPPVDLLSARNIGIASGAFAVIVAGLLIMTARRSRSSQASLITRSLEREKQ